MRQRLARALLLLAQFGKDKAPETVIPKISQENLAEMIWDHPFSRQLLHESVQQTGLYRIQR